MKIGLMGDTHANREPWDRAATIAVKQGWNAIIQLGDFGLFRGYEHYLDHVARTAEGLDVPVYFIDGNHDDHTLLQDWGLFDATEPGSLPEPWEWITYLPRGCAWTWNGVRFGSMGGAGSIDREWRIRMEHRGAPKMWWKTETITETQRDFAKTNLARAGCDVLICHDAPSLAIPGLEVLKETKSLGMLRVSRDCLCDVIRAATPPLVIHGHMHHYYETHLTVGSHACRVVGFDCDNQPKAIGELTLSDSHAWISG